MKIFSTLTPAMVPLGTPCQVRDNNGQLHDAEIIGWHDGYPVFFSEEWPHGVYDQLGDPSRILFHDDFEATA